MRILFGSIVVDARGKLNGHVFRKTATGHSLQRKANQSKNARVGRTAQFQKLVSSLRQYGDLTTAERQNLTDFAQLHPLPNRFGVLRALPARAMYQKLNANLLTANLGPLNVMSVSSVLPAVTFSNVIYTPSKKELEFLPTSDAFPFYVRVYYALTQGKSPSVDISKKRLASVKNVTTSGIAIVGLKSQDAVNIESFQGSVFFGLQVMNSSGWVGAIQWFSV